MEKDFYSILGLTDQEKSLKGKEFEDVVKNKYKKLALKWHPDKFATKSEEERKEAEDKFKEISEAYNTLSDEKKRMEYDMQNIAGGYNPFAGHNPFGEDFDPFDLFGGGSRRRGPQQAPPIRITVEATAKELFEGSSVKTINYERMTPCSECNGTGSSDGKKHTCPNCNGSGYISKVFQQGNIRTIQSAPCPHCGGTGTVIDNPCHKCNGSGVEKKTVSQKIKIEAGTFPGETMVIPGAGNIYPDMAPGDLYITIVQTDEKDYKILNDGTVVKEMNIPLFDAILGSDVEVELLSGKKKTIKLKELTPDGFVKSFSSEGFPSRSGFRIGMADFVVRFHYEYPNKLTSKQRELLKKIKNDKSDKK